MPRLITPWTGGGTNSNWSGVGSASGAPIALTVCRAGIKSKSATRQSTSATPFARKGRSNIVLPNQVREYVVSPLAIKEEFFVDCSSLLLVVQPRKSEDMVSRPFGCVVSRGPCFHEESPIT